MIHSVAGLLENGRLVRRPPFREPHHAASQAALAGGGGRARPGEISLAHRGVLFLDEMPEFPKPALEVLRQPLESGRITVARALAHVTYPARFQLIAAMNPCRCGFLGADARECSRAPRCGEDYQSKLSGALLDRIDICVAMQPISAMELSRAPAGEPSEVVRARVAAARALQAARGCLNAELPPTRVVLRPEARILAEQVMTRLGLSTRGCERMLRVARSIADLGQADAVRRQDVAEALAFRARVPGQGVRAPKAA